MLNSTRRSAGERLTEFAVVCALNSHSSGVLIETSLIFTAVSTRLMYGSRMPSAACIFSFLTLAGRDSMDNQSQFASSFLITLTFARESSST